MKFLIYSLTFSSIIIITSSIIYFSSKCGNDKKLIYTKVEKFQIVKIKPPKRLYLDLKRISDGRVFYEIYISKRCNNLCINLYDTIDVKYSEYEKSDGRLYYEFDNNSIYNLICK